MLAAALRFSLLLELVVYGLIAGRLFDLPVGVTAACALAVLFGLRAGIVATTWLFAAAYHSPAPRLGFWRTTTMALAEYLAFLILFLVIQPWERLWLGADRLPAGRPLLLLVHGYGCNRGAWWWLRRRLETAGFAVATLNLEPVYCSIDDYVATLAERIEEACAEVGCAQLALVGHSMGGLVARAYLAAHGGARVGQLVTIATPHAGSALAAMGLGANARQMQLGSPWLKALPAAPGVPAIALRNSHDNFVMPQDNQRLRGARDVELVGIGHLAVLFSPRAADALRRALADGA